MITLISKWGGNFGRGMVGMEFQLARSDHGIICRRSRVAGRKAFDRECFRIKIGNSFSLAFRTF